MSRRGVLTHLIPGFIYRASNITEHNTAADCQSTCLRIDVNAVEPAQVKGEAVLHSTQGRAGRMSAAGGKEREINGSCDPHLACCESEYMAFKMLTSVGLPTALATSSPVAGDIATEYEGAPKLFQRSVAFPNAVVLGKVIVV